MAWPSLKARKVLKALKDIGWIEDRQPGTSHKTLKHPTRGSYTWAFPGGEELGPRMLARIAKRTGLTPEDL